MVLISRILFTIAAVVIALYLWAARPHWFSEFESQITTGSNPIYSDPIDIGRQHTVSWEVPNRDRQLREGQAKVSLVLERKEDIPHSHYQHSGMVLRVRFNAYAITEDQRRLDRRIQNWYFKTDEPIPNGRLWVYGNTEHGLGGVMIYPFEQLYIELKVLEPDSVLASANPRLKIVGDHDYAVFGHTFLPRLIRDGGFTLCIGLLALMIFMYWKRTNRGTRAS